MTAVLPDRTTASVTLETDLAPGPNPPEIQRRVPFAMTDANHVPKERYCSREFFELEKKYLWPYAWLMAARLEEIPKPGDYVGIRDRRQLDPRRPPAGRLSEGPAQRLPAPGHSVGEGLRPSARWADRVSLSRLALGSGRVVVVCLHGFVV